MAAPSTTPSPNTPIIVGAGQHTEREAGAAPPVELAARAAQVALDACGAEGVSEGDGDGGGNDGGDSDGGSGAMAGKVPGKVAGAIDTIASIRLFSDSARAWPANFGRSDNPPQSIARRLGASPASRIYSEAGGNQPQSLLIEFFKDLQAGRRGMVLLTGAEAIRNERVAQREGRTLDWNESFAEQLEDRGAGSFVASNQERYNGMLMPVYYYAIMEEARRQQLGLGREEYLARSARLLESFSRVAADNPHSQFPKPMSAREILAAEPMTHLYTKRMVAQDGVNQAAALLLTTVGRARALGIPDSNWVYMHGAAEGGDVFVGLRPDPGRSLAAAAVVDHCLAMAGKAIADIDLVDIYSCFPVAVTAVAEHLGLPTDGSRALTLTGGLPYFGGPGNGYSVHALAEMWSRLCASQDEPFAFVHANGGFLSKHASGVFSRQPSAVDWPSADTSPTLDGLPSLRWSADPKTGTVLAYTVNYLKGEPVQGIALCETDDGGRFVACTAPDDTATVRAMLDAEPAGRQVRVEPPAAAPAEGEADPAPEREYRLHFQFV